MNPYEHLTPKQIAEIRALIYAGLDRTASVLGTLSADPEHPLAMEGARIRRKIDDAPDADGTTLVGWNAEMMAWNIKVTSLLMGWP